jgi:hypothetical protein
MAVAEQHKTIVPQNLAVGFLGPIGDCQLLSFAEGLQGPQGEAARHTSGRHSSTKGLDHTTCCCTARALKGAQQQQELRGCRDRKEKLLIACVADSVCVLQLYRPALYSKRCCIAVRADAAIQLSAVRRCINPVWSPNSCGNPVPCTHAGQRMVV